MEYKKLYRDRKETILGGVCGGLGVYLKLDPTIVRLLFVALQLVGWPMIIVYIIMWIITPLAPAYFPTSPQTPDSSNPA